MKCVGVNTISQRGEKMQAIKAISYLISNYPGKYHMVILNNEVRLYENKRFGRAILIERIKL